MQIGIYEVVIKEIDSMDYTDAIEETWSCNGVLHREDGPAKTIKDIRSGITVLSQYYRHGQIHRDGDPAETLILRDSDTGVLEKIETFYQRGVTTRPNDKPSITTYDANTGKLLGEIYRNEEGEDHREIGASSWWRCANTGVMRNEQYRYNGMLHRVDGPALITRDPFTGVLTQESYHINGQIHRTDGPAVIERHRDTGEVLLSENWRNGNRYDPNDKRLKLD